MQKGEEGLLREFLAGLGGKLSPIGPEFQVSGSGHVHFLVFTEFRSLFGFFH